MQANDQLKITRFNGDPRYRITAETKKTLKVLIH